MCAPAVHFGQAEARLVLAHAQSSGPQPGTGSRALLESIRSPSGVPLCISMPIPRLQLRPSEAPACSGLLASMITSVAALHDSVRRLSQEAALGGSCDLRQARDDTRHSFRLTRFDMISFTTVDKKRCQPGRSGTAATRCVELSQSMHASPSGPAYLQLMAGSSAPPPPPAPQAPAVPLRLPL